ncbi:MAG TPA: PAS domain S-box protein [Acidobacteriaceae bacterium]
MFDLVTWISGGVAIVLGVGVIVGWCVGSAFLKSVVPGMPVMKFNTAICFVLMGLALLLLARMDATGFSRWVAGIGQACAATVIAVGLLALLEDGFGMNLRIDELFVRDTSVNPGRMVPLTAIAFVCMGTAVLLLHRFGRKGAFASQTMAAIGNLFGLWGVLDILLSPVVSSSGIAAHTALGLWILSFGVLCACPDQGFLRVLTGEAAGGRVARRLVPAAIGIPLLMGLLRQRSILAFDQEIGVSSMVVASTFVLALVVLWTASELERIDAARRLSEAKFRGLLETAPDAGIVVDAAGTICVVNAQAERVFGYERSELLGQPVEMLVPQRFRRTHADLRQAFFSEPVMRRMGRGRELPALRKDGSEFPAEVSLGSFAGEEETLVSCAIRDITERKAMQEQLYTSQQRLALALAAAQAGTFDWDIKADINEWSPETLELYGLNPGEADKTRKQWIEGLIPEDLESARGALADAMRSGNLAAEWRIRRRNNGQVRWISVKARVLPDEFGKPSRMIGVLIDATDHKRAEQEIKETQRKLALALTAGQMGAWDLDLNTGECWRSAEHDHIFGYPGPEPNWELERFLGHVLPLDRPMVDQAFVEAYRTGHMQLECRIVRADRAERWVSIDGDVVYDEHDSPVRMHGVIQDVSRRKQIEEDLRATQERFNMLMEGVRDYDIMMLDPSGRIETWNRGAQRHRGFSAEEVIGKDISILYSEEDAAAGKPRMELERAARDGEMVDQGWRVRKDGSRFWARVVITALKDSNGTLRGFSKLVRDVTALRNADEEIKRSNAELQQFAYVASHDLQEPLRMVASYTQLLAQRYQGKLDADADDFIGFAVDGARRMQNLIEDLLTYSRVSSRAKTPDLCESADVVENALHGLSVAVQESGAVVEVGELPQIRCDPSQMASVFQNLIGNAIKFRSASVPCVVQISSVRRNGDWVFSVKDNGVGIEPRHFDRIFQVFQRLQTRETHPGNGIGLAICKKVIERHGGRIWLESEPGKGTTFYFTIPSTTATVPKETAHADFAYSSLAG